MKLLTLFTAAFAVLCSFPTSGVLSSNLVRLSLCASTLAPVILCSGCGGAWIWTEVGEGVGGLRSEGVGGLRGVRGGEERDIEDERESEDREGRRVL